MAWIVIIIWACCGILFLYTILPDIFLHHLGLGSRKRHYLAGVALTFDDGPDPENTPAVLELLRRHNVQAVFFLVGEKARKYPEIVREIDAQGHLIGAHSLEHHLSWLETPLRTWRDWNKSVAILETITGKPVHWIRPPWGTFNLALWCWLQYKGKKAVLWNVEGHDWLSKRKPEEIAASILKRTREGAIVLLHDSGGEEGATKNSLQALEIICDKITAAQKLPLVRLSFPDWSIGRRLTFILWEKWEHLFAWLRRLERINATNLLRLTKVRYRGPCLYDEKGCLLAKQGDIVGEIHIDSIRLQGEGTDIHKLGIKALRQARDSLPVLARYISENPKYREIKVFIGLTLLNRGVKGLGFNVQDLDLTWRNRFVGYLQRLIICIYHPAGRDRGTRRLGQQPKLVWISREKLLQHWLPAAPPD